ncbi:unnamed protein product [Lactuca virosa]|uniref:RanBP2-type domain-containing protein n=1 Tax=Lactuca virosa TaxID=75947 RepID=A0AAU9N0J5_9ASTR|nr:unnamed protein product [Lactuca virosa]
MDLNVILIQSTIKSRKCLAKYHMELILMKNEHETAWEAPVTKEEIVQKNVWSCPICTYDNEEYMSSCDICGVLRNPLIKSSNNGQSSTVVPNLEKPSTSDAPSNKKMENTNLKSNAKSSNKSPPLISKDKPQHMENNNIPQTHNISTELNNMTMSGESGTSKIANKGKTGKTASRSQYKPEKWMLLDEGEDRLSQLNLAIVGHGKGSFAYAWALDESVEERERGITMTVGVAFFNSKKHHVVVLDSPGHKDFVPNMISGIDSAGGQTREHAQLIRSFGVDQIIVSVNKMDAVQYSKERFDHIKLQLGVFLRSCNFKDSNVTWVPLSAMENQNLVAPPSDARLLSWYKGGSLLEAIDALQPPAREYSKPLLMPICDVIKLPSQGQVSACGKLESGALRNGTKVMILPSGDIGTVRSLERDSQACSIARAGDNVAVTLQNIDANVVISGGVLCHPDFPVSITNHLELKILVLDVQTPVLIGSQLEFHIHHAKEVARVAKIVSLLDAKTGKVTKKSPRCLLSKQTAIVEVMLQGEVCVDEFSSSRALGRVFLRSSGTTVAVGVVTRVIVDDQS